MFSVYDRPWVIVISFAGSQLYIYVNLVDIFEIDKQNFAIGFYLRYTVLDSVGTLKRWFSVDIVQLFMCSYRFFG